MEAQTTDKQLDALYDEIRVPALKCLERGNAHGAWSLLVTYAADAQAAWLNDLSRVGTPPTGVLRVIA